MVDIPTFKLYGDGDPRIEEAIQPRLGLRNWSDLETGEKQTALKYIINRGWLDNSSMEILNTAAYLNHHYLRQCPCKRLHEIKPERNMRGTSNEYKRMEAAFDDFKDIFVNEKSDAMVLRMLSCFAQNYIDEDYLKWAKNEEEDDEKKESHLENAFEKFDRLAVCLNHMFDQFSVNVQISRNGLFPKQDEKISENIYEPTLKILADPKWKSVSDDLAQVFIDYRDGNYSEVITKAHSSVQRFLQVLVGKEGKSGKGEFKTLFAKAKKEGILPSDRFTVPMIEVFKGFFSSERATNSTAKPALKDTTPQEAMLMMNVVMVFIQHCLQNSKLK